MCAAVICGDDAGIGADYPHIELCVGRRDKDLVKAAACCEGAEGMCKGHHSGGRQTCGNTYHVSLLDATVNSPVGIGLEEGLHARRAYQVGIEDADAGILFGKLHKGLAIDLAHLDLFFFKNRFYFISTH